jgi:thioredoxin reductase
MLAMPQDPENLPPSGARSLAAQVTQVCVIGAGPAGLGCALFLARAGLSPLVIDAGGSRLAQVQGLINYPGIERITGAELLAGMRRQASAHGALYLEATVERARDLGDRFSLELSAGREVVAEHLVMAAHKGSPLYRQLALEQDGPFLAVGAEGRTSHPRVWACGVAAKVVPGHAVVSAGDGARVAVMLASSVLGRHWKDHNG